MRTCVSCGDPIPEDKRKDARYCGKSKCRGREYRKRHPKPETLTKPHEHQSSTVLACACGRRYLLAITELHDAEAATASAPAPRAAVTQTDERTVSSATAPSDKDPRAITRTDLQTDRPTRTPVHLSPAAYQDSAAITRTVLLTDSPASDSALFPPTNHQPHLTAEAPPIASSSPDVTDDAPATVTHASSPTSQPAPNGLTTLDLSFCDATGRTLGFRDAVARNSAGEWALLPGARVVFRGQERDARCLGGTPGRWKQYYAGRSPSQFGFDADLAVMYWDARERRGRAASANVLHGILGDNWKRRLREICDEQLARRS